jgi:signal transduction histidine kinase
VDVRFSEAYDSINVEISNNGPALEVGEEERIFDLGIRGKNASAVRRGFGIGLHFVKELVEKHHQGTITFTQTGLPQNVRGVPYKNSLMRLTFQRVR